MLTEVDAGHDEVEREPRLAQPQAAKEGLENVLPERTKQPVADLPTSQPSRMEIGLDRTHENIGIDYWSNLQHVE